MNSFEIDRLGADLRLCLTSGQVFRFQEISPDVWFGAEGDHWFHITDRQRQWSVETSASKGEFRAIFGLDNCLWQHLESCEPGFCGSHSAFAGLRLMQPQDAEETLFCFLCSANNHLSRIRTMIASLSEFGELRESPRGTWRRFPRAEQIANLEEAELRDRGFGYRAKSIPEVARQIVSRGPNWLIQLKQATMAEARRELCQIPSIGPKLADCIALYGLHHQEATPVDTHLWQAYCKRYDPGLLGSNLTSVRHAQVADFLVQRFGAGAGYAQLLLYFHHMKSKPSVNSKP